MDNINTSLNKEDSLVFARSMSMDEIIEDTINA
jgi:hypothetical protein